MKHQLRWFKNRIGKFIYRAKISNCNCASCQKTKIYITPEHNHAQYLFDCQNSLGIEYQDKPI